MLNVLVESATYDTPALGKVPYLDAVATMNPADGKIALFLLNRDIDKAHSVEINWEGKTPGNVLFAQTITGSDLKAFNSFEAPQRVVPQALDKPSTSGGRTKFEVPARSYTVIQWGA